MQKFIVTFMRRFAKIGGGLLLIYILVYSALSIFGSYQPIAVGVFGAEEFAWAPFGFYDPNHAWAGSSYAVRHPSERTGGWHSPMMWAFLPLWALDIKLIHNQQRPSNTALEPISPAP